jgi:hypothetical protein
MRRSSHGTIFTFDDFQGARDAVVGRGAEAQLGFAVAARRVVTEDFGPLFPELQNSPKTCCPRSARHATTLSDWVIPCEIRKAVWVEETPVSRRPTSTSGSSSTMTLPSSWSRHNCPKLVALNLVPLSLNCMEHDGPDRIAYGLSEKDGTHSRSKSSTIAAVKEESL